MKNNFIFLAGLPRSGSTLIPTVLCQNPIFFHIGNSPLAQLMWDLNLSSDTKCSEQINATNSRHRVDKILSCMAGNFYFDCKDKIILDKCRTWGLHENMCLIKKHIDKNPKIIATVRNLEDIVKSFIYIRQKNGWNIPVEDLFKINTNPLMLPLESIVNLYKNEKQVLFINYDNFIENPIRDIERIYNFLGTQYYEHDLLNIKDLNFENDDFYKMTGYHEIRSTISKRNLGDINLSNSIIEKIKQFEPILEKIYPLC